MKTGLQLIKPAKIRSNLDQNLNITGSKQYYENWIKTGCGNRPVRTQLDPYSAQSSKASSNPRIRTNLRSAAISSSKEVVPDWCREGGSCSGSSWRRGRLRRWASRRRWRRTRRGRQTWIKSQHLRWSSNLHSLSIFQQA